jgi:hypothetical protein
VYAPKLKERAGLNAVVMVEVLKSEDTMIAAESNGVEI